MYRLLIETAEETLRRLLKSSGAPEEADGKKRLKKRLSAIFFVNMYKAKFVEILLKQGYLQF